MMAEQSTQSGRVPAVAPRPRSIWITLEGSDIIELKQIMLDRDAAGAADFFQRVIVPQVREAARQRGIITDAEFGSESDGSLSR